MVEPSVGTLLNIGDCRERLGKIATAWAAFRKAEALAKQSNKEGKRLAEARRRAQRLEPQLPSLTIQVAKPMPGMIVKRNGEKLETGLYNTDVPVDPGNVHGSPPRRPATSRGRWISRSRSAASGDHDPRAGSRGARGRRDRAARAADRRRRAAACRAADPRRRDTAPVVVHHESRGPRRARPRSPSASSARSRSAGPRITACSRMTSRRAPTRSARPRCAATPPVCT